MNPPNDKEHMDPDDIVKLPASWYINQPIPERLIRALGDKPVLNESDMSKTLAPDVDIRRRDVRLTNREIQVLTLLSHGLTNNQVADMLSLEVSTIQSHVKRIRHVLSAKNTPHAVG